jgi:hypothetical protein
MLPRNDIAENISHFAVKVSEILFLRKIISDSERCDTQAGTRY